MAKKQGTRDSRKVNYAINHLELNDEQIVAKKIIEQSDLSIIFGKAGSGKTFIATATAIQMLIDRQIEQIVLTRPTVSDENIGYLPGTLDEKMDP